MATPLTAAPVSPLWALLDAGGGAGRYSEEQPFWATLAESRRLTAAACDKRVLHVSLDVAGAGMQFEPGDAFSVHPSNDPALVRGLLDHLGADGSQCAPPAVAFFCFFRSCAALQVGGA